MGISPRQSGRSGGEKELKLRFFLSAKCGTVKEKMKGLLGDGYPLYVLRCRSSQIDIFRECVYVYPLSSTWRSAPCVLKQKYE